MKYLYLSLIALLLTACQDNLGTNTSQSVLRVTLDMPQLPDGAKIDNAIITAFNISTQSATMHAPEGDIYLLPGLYDISYSANVTSPGKASSSLRGSKTAVQVTDPNVEVALQVYNNIESDDLIIAEVFFSGTMQSSGNSYYGDDYIKLYNNTNHTIYADGITIFESKFLTTEKRVYDPDIMADAMTVQALYTIPGNGTDVPVLPGEELLICDTGIDHRTANPNSFNLSHAAFEWYDQSSNPSTMDIDGPVANLDKWYCYTQTIWMLHNRGFKAFGIARIPIDRDTYLKNYYYDYDFTQVTIAGEFPMSQSAYRLPNEWIIDVVNCSIESDYAWCVTSPRLDCGWTGCGTINNDKTRFFHSIRRKLLFITDDGRAVFKDTNNSTDDFNRMCIASEIERQGTVCDMAGNRATQCTYDGITPMQ